MAPRMQMLVTRFERLSRRISLAGLLSGHGAQEAIKQGRVHVDGTVATTNFKVFNEAMVTVDGREVPAPRPGPRLWGLRKPKKVLCQEAEVEGTETLRSLMRGWKEKEQRHQGNAQAVGLDEESLDDKHFVVVCGLPYNADGLVLLTNDGLFADALMSGEGNILTEYDVKVSGDPPVELLHQWRAGQGARAGGVNFGQVFSSITRRSPSACRLRIRYVETPDRPLEMLLERAKIRVNRLRRYAFGPYIETELPPNRLVPLPVHASLRSFVPVPDIRQALVPATGAVISQSGHLRSTSLEDSVIIPAPRSDA